MDARIEKEAHPQEGSHDYAKGALFQRGGLVTVVFGGIEMFPSA